RNNLVRFFPLLFSLSKITNKKLYYFMIGGWLAEFLSSRPKLAQKLGRIEKIFCETHVILNELKKSYSFGNLDYFPNYRTHTFRPELTNVNDEHIKIVYMGRIHEKKGIEDIFAISRALVSQNIINFSVTLFGS